MVNLRVKAANTPSCGSQSRLYIPTTIYRVFLEFDKHPTTVAPPFNLHLTRTCAFHLCPSGMDFWFANILVQKIIAIVGLLCPQSDKK